MLTSSITSLSKAAILNRFASGQSPDGAELEELFAEVRRRSELAPHLYPFRDLEDSIVLSPEIDGRVYVFLLLLTVRKAPYRESNSYNDVNPSFELLTREALLASIGGRGKGKRFGWPNGDGRPQHLGDAVEWLAEELHLPVGVVRDQVDVDDKDGGIDVVVWQPFADGAPSFNVWLVQCTVQADYQRKKGDIEPKKWLAWINFGSEPTRVLAVPFAIPLDAKVRIDLTYSFGLVLDRLRICELLDGVEHLGTFEEFDFIERWNAAEIGRISKALASAGPRRPRQAKRKRALRKPRNEEPTTD